MSIDFTPGLSPYKETGSFRFWCQKVLPLVYDNSLSYYELLCKVVDYLNDVISNVDGIHEDVEALRNAYIDLQTYVNNYFESLDVQQEINDKLNEMAEDGTLSSIVSPYVPAAVAAWLEENLTPTTPPVDETLSIRGAAADAKAVGDRITAIVDDIDSFTESSDNIIQLLNATKTVLGTQITTNNANHVIVAGTAASAGGRLIPFTDDFILPAGTYTLKNYFDDAAIASRISSVLQSRTTGTNVIATATGVNPATFTLENDTTCYLGFNVTANQVYDNLTFDIMLNAGETALPFTPPAVSAIDSQARENINRIDNEIDSLQADLQEITENPLNLLTLINGTKTVNGTQITTDDANHVIVAGTATDAGGRLTTFTDDFILPAGTYTLKNYFDDSTIASRISSVLQSRTTGTNVIATATGVNPATFTLENDTTCYLGFNVTANQVYDNLTFDIMLNAGETALPFTPPAVSAIDRYARKTLEDIQSYKSITLDRACYESGMINAQGVDGINYNALKIKDFVPVLFDGIVVSPGYRAVIIRYTHTRIFIDREYYITSDTVAENGLNYKFEHANYKYRLYFEKVPTERAVDVLAFSQAITYKFLPKNLPEQIKAEIAADFSRKDVEKNTNERLNALMNETYNIAYANAARPLQLINVYGNNQNVHPKVLYFPNKFGAHSYWMAYTPYPYGILKTENPCIAYSDDGIHWQDIAGNPIDNTDGQSDEYYNSDTHLVYNGARLECWYRLVANGHEEIYRKISTDGFTWASKELLHTTNTGSEVLAPAVIYENNKYCIWAVNNEQRRIDYYESGSGSNWQFIRTIELTFTKGALTYTPWHGDVIHTANQYVMVMMCKSGNTWDSFITLSDDNIVYSTPQLLMEGRENCWDAQMYRLSITEVNEQYYIYYSARNGIIYGIAITASKELDNFIGLNY